MKLPRVVLQFLVGCAIAAAPQSPSAQSPPAPRKEHFLSDELNNELPKWLRVSGEYRARGEGFTGGAFRAGAEDAYLLSRLRLNLVIQPRHGLKFAFQAQDAHVFEKNQNPPAPPYQNSMDLRLGYLEIGDVEKGTIGFRAGRQELAFGDERLIGNLNWTNSARSYDALRGTYRRGANRIDVFAASVVNLRGREFDISQTGNYLYGIYGGITTLMPKATIEPYFFFRRSSGLTTETGSPGILNAGTFGVRWVGSLPLGWDYGVEIDRQTGSLGTDTVGAWAGHWVVGKTIGKLQWKPRIALEYNYASGDRSSNDGHRGTFDHLYPTGHDKYGLADQVGWRNIRNVRASLEMKPAKKWSIVTRYDAWWLADPHDALYNAGGASVARVSDGSAGKFVGQEIDAAVAYSLSRQLQFGGGFGHIFPGTFLKRATPGESHNFPYASTTFVF